MSLLLLFQNNNAGGSATLTAASAAYAFSGNAALFDSGMVEAVGAYTFSGIDAVFNSGLVSAAGTYNLTGTSAGLQIAITANTIGYTLTGNDAALLDSGAGSFTLTANTVSYTFTGFDVILAATSNDVTPSPGGGFSRRRWRKLQEAQEAIEVLALEADTRRERNALDQAAKAAAKAIVALQEEKKVLEFEAKASALCRALEGAAGADRIATVISQSNRAVDLAKQLIRQIEEDDEEEAIALLMLH